MKIVEPSKRAKPKRKPKPKPDPGVAQTIAAVRAYRATRPRDFPVTPADRQLAARIRQLAAKHPTVFLTEARRGRW